MQFAGSIVVLVGLEILELGEGLGDRLGNRCTRADQQCGATPAVAGLVEQVGVKVGSASGEGGMGTEPHLVVLVLE